MESLLAVDTGLKMGIALFGRDGRLCWYRSRRIQNYTKLKRIVHSLLRDSPDITHLVLEGGGGPAEVWRNEAIRMEKTVINISAETWRENLLYPRRRKTGIEAKKNAGLLARQVIEWSGAKRPSALRHDAAEAILIGLWGVLKLGWLGKSPLP